MLSFSLLRTTINFKMMKKKKIDFESEFWDGSNKHSCFTLIEAFFRMDDLAAVKDKLFDVMNYSTKPKVLLKEDPSLIFHFYLCLRSFIKASYVLQLKTTKWKLSDSPEYISRLLQGSLSDEEYKDPLLVFQKAFKEFSLKEFDHFITESVYFSFSSYANDHESNFITFFIHLTKMLDAAQIIRERGVKKIQE